MTEEEKREKKRNKKKKQRRKKQKAAAVSSDENDSIKAKTAADEESVAPVESDNEVDETFEMELSLFT